MSYSRAVYCLRHNGKILLEISAENTAPFLEKQYIALRPNILDAPAEYYRVSDVVRHITYIDHADVRVSLSNEIINVYLESANA